MQKKAICLGLLIILSLVLAGCQGMTAEQNQKLIQDLGKAYATQTQIKIPSEIESQQVSISHKCTDSDYGKNAHDYGYTVDWINDEQIQNKDQCNGNILSEAVCQEGFVKAIEAINCADYGMICTNGACAINPATIDEQQCIDSDSGLNMMEFGFTAEFRNGNQINNDDKCSGNILLEAVCKQGITKATERVRCQDYGMVCDNGVCVPEIDEEQDAGAAADAAGGQRGAAGGTTCIDPDGENKYVIGTLTMVYGDGRQNTYQDECGSERWLGEYVCTVDPNTHAPTFGTRSIDCQATGEVCRGGICVAAGLPRLPGPIQIPGLVPRSIEPFCRDTDGGNVPTLAGTVSRTNADLQILTYPDACVDSRTLTEYYCMEGGDDDYIKKTIDCEAQGKQCINGACAAFQRLNPPGQQPYATLTGEACIDSDNGVNSAVVGHAAFTQNGRTENWQDACNGNILLEQACNGNNREVYKINCTAQGKQCRNSICEPLQLTNLGTQPAQLQNIRLCVDNDGDDRFTAGRVNVIIGTDVRNEVDTCLNTDALREQICGPNNVHGVKTYYCSNDGMTCKDGKCVQLRVSQVQQTLQPGQAIQSPTIIKQYPILDTITIKKLI